MKDITIKKDVLEYSTDELNSMSDETLIELMKEARYKESLFNTAQLVKKLLMNSLYGAMANKYFPLFNEHMARAITGNGRYFIQKMAKEIESGLQALMPLPNDEKYIIYGDTDSNYFTIEPFVNKAFQNKPDATISDKVDFCDKFYKNVVDKFVQKSIDDFGKEYNAYNTDVIGSEREIISDCLHPSSALRIKQNNKCETIKISILAKKYGCDTLSKKEQYIDISSENIYISSHDGNKEVINKIINIQQKVTTKDMYELILPNGKSIKCTEDHLIAVKESNVIIYKKVIDITEDDDVMYRDVSINNKNNAELYGGIK